MKTAKSHRSSVLRGVLLTPAELKAITLPRRIAGRNAKFAAMTDAQKRRAIALDCLQRLATGQTKPTSGEWVCIPLKSGSTLREGADLRKALESKDAPRCEACALGGAVMGLAAWEDRIGVEDVDFYDPNSDKNHREAARVMLNDPFSAHRKRLQSIFGLEQLSLIEYVFERGSPGLSQRMILGGNQANVAMNFGYRHRSYRALYRAIFTSILNHPEGLFCP